MALRAVVVLLDVDEAVPLAETQGRVETLLADSGIGAVRLVEVHPDPEAVLDPETVGYYRR